MKAGVHIVDLSMKVTVEKFKVQFFGKDHKKLKECHTLTLLSKNNVFAKTGGRYFQILGPSKDKVNSVILHKLD